MPRKPAKRDDKTISDVEIYEEDGWYVKYTGTHGKKNIMKLDAETFKDAKHEASHLLDVPEEEIQN